MNKKLIVVLAFVTILLLGEGIYYLYLTKAFPWQKPGPQLIQLEKPKEYVTTENVTNYAAADEKTSRGHLIPGRIFQVTAESESWLKVDIWNAERGEFLEGGWIRPSKTAYKPKK
jgi:hypothetical protein